MSPEGPFRIDRLYAELRSPAAPDDARAIVQPPSDVSAITASPGDVQSTAPEAPVAPPVAWGFSDASILPLLGRPPGTALRPWKIPDDSDYVPDTVLDAAEVSGLQVRAASVRGAQHRLNATVRQDSFALGVSADGVWVVAVVCDGLGSAPRSHLGSTAAARTAAAKLRVALSEPLSPQAAIAQAISAAAGAVRAAAAAGDHEPEELATTISILAVRRAGDGSFTYFSGFIGDSPVMTLDQAGLQPLRAGVAEAVHGTGTSSLPRDENQVQFADGSLPPGTAVLVATDGFAIPALGEAGRPHFASSWLNPPGIIEFLSSVQFLARSYDDDRTVVGIWAGVDAAGPR